MLWLIQQRMLLFCLRASCSNGSSVMLFEGSEEETMLEVFLLLREHNGLVHQLSAVSRALQHVYTHGFRPLLPVHVCATQPRAAEDDATPQGRGSVGASCVKAIIYHACKPNVPAALQHSWLRAQVSSNTYVDAMLCFHTHVAAKRMCSAPCMACSYPFSTACLALLVYGANPMISVLYPISRAVSVPWCLTLLYVHISLACMLG